LSLRPAFPGSSEIVATKRIPLREPNRRHGLVLTFARAATVLPCFEECAQDRQWHAFVLRLGHVVEFGGKPELFRHRAMPLSVLPNEAAQLPLRQFQFEQRLASANAPDSIRRTILAFAVGCRACKRGQARAITSPASAGVKVCVPRMRSCSSLKRPSRSRSNGMTVAERESFAGPHAASANSWTAPHKKSRRGQRRRHRKFIRKRLTRIRVGFGAAAESCVPPARLPLAVRRIQAWMRIEFVGQYAKVSEASVKGCP
jgi:hypothetical protein